MLYVPFSRCALCTCISLTNVNVLCFYLPTYLPLSIVCQSGSIFSRTTADVQCNYILLLLGNVFFTTRGRIEANSLALLTYRALKAYYVML